MIFGESKEINHDSREAMDTLAICLIWNPEYPNHEHWLGKSRHYKVLPFDH